MKHLIFFIAILGLTFSQLVSGQSIVLKPEKVSLPEAYTTTIPLRDMEIVPPTEKTDWKNGIIPNKELTPAQRNKTGKKPPVYGPDPVLQQNYNPGSPSPKAVIQNFEGIGNLCNCAPPDTDGDVGPNHYVQMVNNAFQIFDKSGTALTSPANLSTIWQNLPGPWVGTSNGDPIVLYDEIADRWLLTQFSLPNYPNGPFYELLAVSTTSDPTGSYHLYAYSFTDMPDYPKFGIWPDGYYMSINQFSSGALNWAGAGAVVFERSQMLNGNAAQMVFFNFTSAQAPWSFLPSDVDGPIPPAGTPNYFVYLEDVFSTGTDRLRIHELSVDWVNTSNSTFTGPLDINVAAFNPSVSGIPQPGSSQTLDPLSSRLMYRVQYRNFGSHQTLVTNHTVNAGSGAGVRWYELRNTGAGWYMYQQGTYAPVDGNRRWMASAAMNVNGDIAIGYSIAGGIAPSIRYTGRLSTDPLGTMTIAETTVITGNGAQTGTNRWGDYSAMSVDPSDDFTFWYTQEYVNPGGNFAWRTRINSMQFGTVPNNPPVANFVADNTMPASSFVTVNFTDLSTNSPSIWLWSFSPNTVTYVSGSSTSQNPSVQFNNPGAYTVTLTATNTYGSDSEIKLAYIHMGTPGLWVGGTPGNLIDWNITTNWENHMVPTSTTNVSILPTTTNWPTKTGNLTIGTDCNSLNMASGYTELTVIGDLTIAAGKSFTVDPSGIPDIKVGGNWVGTGTFTTGQSTVILNGGTNSTITGPLGTMTIFNDGFEGASAWTLSGEFQMGSPTGLGGEHGNADPTSAYLGSNVLGVDLTGLGSYNGDYEINLGDRTYQAISPTINCTGFTNVSMNFQRWLNVESPSYDHAYIDISNNNGANWTQIWTNSSVIEESNWSLQTIDISSYADNQAQVKIRFCIGITDGSWQYSGWNIDEFNVTGSATLNAVFNNLSIEKSNALVSTNSDVDVLQDITIKPGAYFTNSVGNTFNVLGNAWFMADPSGMASYIDNGTTSVTGTTNIEQYITSQRWHLVSPPISGAIINVYYDIYLKEYNEPTDTWTYLVQPTSIPMNQAKGYSAWASNSYTGTTTVTYAGTLSNTDFVINTLDYTPAAAMTGFNLLGNPYPCALDWNSNWTMSNMSGWMVVYDNGTFRGIHTDGTPYNGKTDGIIPSTQGFWVRALNASASLTIPASERVHNGQAFYKESKENIYPMVRLETEINGYSDETVIIFHPEATAGFDGYYDLAKFENVEEAPQLYTMTADGNYAVNFYEPDYQEKIIPVGFKTAEEGLFIINASTISNFNGDIGIYLEDLKTGTITKLSDNPQYEFIYNTMDEEHRFNLHFTTEQLGIEETTLSGLKIYSFGHTVYVKNSGNVPGEIKIFDVMGQLIITGKTVSTLTEIPITQGLGYYFVKVQTGTDLKIEKVFIK